MADDARPKRLSLRIEPDGENFVVMGDDGELKATGCTLAEAEEARARWQAQIDAGGEPDGWHGGILPETDLVAREQIAALEAQTAALRALVEKQLEVPPRDEDQENALAASILEWLLDLKPNLGSAQAFEKVSESPCCPPGIKKLSPTSYRWRRKIFGTTQRDARTRRRKK